jgi:tryptophanyl-tRNA synthetase
MSINELKNIFEKINEDKEKIKLKIQTIFTNLRNQLNEREDFLLLEVDNKFNECYFSENLIKDSEKLPKSIIKNLEKGKLLLNGMKDKEKNKLNSFVNDCINIVKILKIILKVLI